jgi:ABC-type ATPase with predicted acetyltransferase domain
MKRWLCMDCRNAVELDKHGRCGNCESEAVDLAETENGLTASVSSGQATSFSHQTCI